MKPHHSVTTFLLTLLISLQIARNKSTPALYNSVQGLISHHHGMVDSEWLLTLSTLRWCLALSFPNSLSAFHLLKTRQPAQLHGDDNIALMQGVVITVFCHGHCLSHHTKWSLHEHQQVLGTGFLCTAWLSHSCGEWISVVPCKEAVFFQNKQKPQTKWNQKDVFPP